MNTLRLIIGLLLLSCLGARALAVGPPGSPKFPFAGEAAARYQRGYAEQRKLPLEIKNNTGIALVLIPPGKFTMGSPEQEPGHKGDERQHEVTLTRGFYLAKHEVTVGQFRAFVKASEYKTDVEKTGGGHAHDEKAVWEHHPGTHWQKPGYAGKYEQGDDHPVVHVSHTDALAFCKWLNESAAKIDGLAGTYELPTESEWEWACRAGSGARFSWGDDEDASGKVANVGDVSLKEMHAAWPRSVMKMDDGHAYVAPVGTYRANAFGLHDMLGNVWEFCGSRHGEYPKEAATDPSDLSKAESYSVRGGGWSNVADDCRCAARNADPIHFGHSNLGFRVALRLK